MIPEVLIAEFDLAFVLLRAILFPWCGASVQASPLPSPRTCPAVGCSPRQTFKGAKASKTSNKRVYMYQDTVLFFSFLNCGFGCSQPTPSTFFKIISESLFCGQTWSSAEFSIFRIPRECLQTGLARWLRDKLGFHLDAQRERALVQVLFIKLWRDLPAVRDATSRVTALYSCVTTSFRTCGGT
jgi:hypothetical protein